MNASWSWQGITNIPAKRYVCGFCGADVAPVSGWTAIVERTSTRTSIAVCHLCTRPTFFDFDGSQTPGVPFGDSIKDIDDASVKALYEEARRATSASCFTSAVLACRKLLMHIAVAKGAQPGTTFISYVEHLSSQGYVPPDAKAWVDHIRTKSNEANHEIALMTSEDARELLEFTGMLLQLVYEFPAAMKRKLAAKPPP